MNNETIDYTLICNNKQEIVLNRTVVIGVSVIKRLRLYEFSLWGQDFVSVVRIMEVIFIKNVCAFFRDQVNCPY